MIHRALFTLFLLIGVALFTACSPTPASPTPVQNMPNPAAAYCEQHGGKLEIVTAADDS
jgi:putative hemolysin